MSTGSPREPSDAHTHTASARKVRKTKVSVTADIFSGGATCTGKVWIYQHANGCDYTLEFQLRKGNHFAFASAVREAEAFLHWRFPGHVIPPTSDGTDIPVPDVDSSLPLPPLWSSIGCQPHRYFASLRARSSPGRESACGGFQWLSINGFFVRTQVVYSLCRVMYGSWQSR